MVTDSSGGQLAPSVGSQEVSLTRNWPVALTGDVWVGTLTLS